MLPTPFLSDDIEWHIETGLLDYDVAVADMDARAEAIFTGTAKERIWLVEHPPLYTGGTSAQAGDLISAAPRVGVLGRQPARHPGNPAGQHEGSGACAVQHPAVLDAGR